METTVTFSINEVGEKTGMPYEGKFTVKTILSRRESFIADERRRIIIGSNPTAVAPALSGEAYILGQLHVHIVDSPKWWQDSDSGLELQDINIIEVLYTTLTEKIKEKQSELMEKTKVSLEKLTKSSKKITAE